MALVAALLIAIGAIAYSLTGVISRRPAIYSDDDFELAGAIFERADFSDLSGWRLDETDASLPAFIRSCERLSQLPDDAPVGDASSLLVASAGVAGDWRSACQEGPRVLAQPYADANAKTSAVRAFYEYHFRPVRIYARLTPKPGGIAVGEPERHAPLGRFTGYFEPFYEASPERTAVYSAPVYARPEDLVTVDLGRFRPELTGQRVAGRLNGGVLDPYPDHAAINAGAIVGRARVLAWMRPTDLFFLQIQGSGRLSLPSGEVRVGYDGANGRQYTAIGRTLIDKGALTRDAVSMKSIRDWLSAATDSEARKVRETNQSFVFFRILDALPDQNLGPPGAEGAQLTPGRSLAIDPAYVAYGAPVWISIDGQPDKNKEPVRRLLIAQDTGGAIKGPVRGDIFVGSGPLAGDVAGGFNELGEMYVLLPTKIAEKLPMASKQ
ncbi:MAG: MltA domain-containing protein [Pseudomonadota bacterium]